MRRSYKITLVILFVLVVLPIGLGAGALFYANSAGGQERLQNLAARYVPGLTIEGLHGSLPGSIGVRRLRYADAQGNWLELDDADIELGLSALFQRELLIRDISASRIVVARAPVSSTPPAPSTPRQSLLPQLPNLPLGIRVERIALARIELGAPLLGQAAALKLDGSAGLVAGQLSAQLALQRLDAPGSATVNVALAPGANRLHADISAQEPANGLVAALTKLPNRPAALQLTLDGPASGAALDLSASLGPDITVHSVGQLRLGPDGSIGTTLNTTMAAAPLLPPQYAGLAMPLKVALNADLSGAQVLQLTNLAVNTPGVDLTANGRVDLEEGGVDLTAKAKVQDASHFAGLVPPATKWVSIDADAHLTGSLKAPVVALEVRPQGLATGTPQADALLGATPVLTAHGRYPAQDGTLTLQGKGLKLDVSGDVAAPINVKAVLDVPNLAPVQPGAAGSLRLEATAKGALDNPVIDLSLNGDHVAFRGQQVENLHLTSHVATPMTAPQVQADLDARYGGEPVKLTVRGAPEGQKLRLQQADATFGNASVQIAGLVDIASKIFDGTLKVAVPDLAPFGRLAGTPLAGRVDANGRFTDAQGVQGLDLGININRLAVSGQTGSAKATVKGTLNKLDFVIGGDGAGAQADLRGSFAQSAAGKVLELTALNLRHPKESIRLAGPARVTMAPNGGITIANLALVPGRGGRLEASGRWGPERADLRIRLQNLPFALAQAVLPDPKIGGSMSGDITVTGPTSAPEARIALEGQNIAAQAPWSRGLPALQFRVNGTASQKAADIRAEVTGGKGLSLQATAQLPRGFAATDPVTATLRGNADLTVLSQPFLAAGANRATGRADLDVRVGGTVGKPEPAGSVTLTNASFRNAQWGAALTAINARMAMVGRQLQIQQFHARGGTGTLAISGTVETDQPDLPANIKIEARKLQPAASPFGTMALNADLALTGPLTNGGQLGGKVTILRSELRIPDSLPASQTVLQNVRTRGVLPKGAIPPQGATATPAATSGKPTGATPGKPGDATAEATAGAPPASAHAPIRLAVDVAVPGEVFIRGRGLDVEMGGNLKVGGTVVAPQVVGTLAMRRGTLDILTKHMTFTRGRILFDNGTLMPGLDLLATSVSGDYTINVAVEGDATQPKITLSSNPELPQDEVLSQLLFGRSAGSLTALEAVQMADALATLAGSGTGSGGVMSKVRGALGLDRLGFESDSSGNPELAAGRYVAKNVYVGVRQGTGNLTGSSTTSSGSSSTTPGFGVEWEVRPRLKLEAQTNTGAAGDRVGVSYGFDY